MESDDKRISPEQSIIGEIEVHTSSVSNDVKILDSKKDSQESSFSKEEFNLVEFPSTANGTVEAYPSLNNRDLKNFILLVVLYLLQGIPVGLAFGSIPFLLKSKLSYSQIGFFSLATYPYSLKLLWSPVVDATYSKKFGRRKSWIIPIQLLTGSVFFWLGKHVDQMFDEDTPNVYALTDVPSEKGLLELGSYLTFWALVYFAVTLWLLLAKSEDSPQAEDHMDIKTVYQTIWGICKMPHMRKLITVLLVAKIGFIANEAVTGLKLLEKGFSKEDLALAVLIDFPIQIVVGYYAAKWRYCSIVLIEFNADTALLRTSTVQFVSISAFMTIIADPVIGGTYMTLLATFSNFGGTWPRFFVLEAVDYFTDATCHNQDAPFPCVSEQDKALCDDFGGTCVVDQDGYYITSVACVTIGTLLLLGFILPQIKKLQ
ncbi:1110_t:CDS:2, partial [Acaulospora colombiana]